MQYPKDWKEEENKLVKEFVFNTFKEAITFINKIAALAEEQNHHPEIHLYNYNEIQIGLSTHDAGNKITEKDRVLAEKINLL